MVAGMPMACHGGRHGHASRRPPAPILRDRPAPDGHAHRDRLRGPPRCPPVRRQGLRPVRSRPARTPTGRPCRSLTDPLAALPGGATAVVHFDPRGHSSLQLSVSAAGFTLRRLSSGPPEPDGTPTWRVAVPVCFAAAALPGAGVRTHPVRHRHTRGRHPRTRSPARSGTDRFGADRGIGRRPLVSESQRPAAAAFVVPAGRIDSRDVAGLPVFASADIRYDLATGTIDFDLTDGAGARSAAGSREISETAQPPPWQGGPRWPPCGSRTRRGQPLSVLGAATDARKLPERLPAGSAATERRRRRAAHRPACPASASQGWSMT